MERLTKRISDDCIELSANANPKKFVKWPQRVYKSHDYWNVFKKLLMYEEQEEVKENPVIHNTIDGYKPHKPTYEELEAFFKDE